MAHPWAVRRRPIRHGRLPPVTIGPITGEEKTMAGQATDFERGICNAVRQCMGVTAADRAIVITDAATERIGAALAAEAAATGATVTLLRLEAFGQRPFTSAPTPVLTEVIRQAQPTVTFYAAQAQVGEIAFRIPLMNFLLRELNVRHGHLIGIDERLVGEGLGADYQLIARLTERVADWVRPAHEITVTSPHGTNLVAHFSPTLRWVPCPGLYHLAGRWGNLPEGEIFTSPQRVDGVLAGEVIGDFFSSRYGVLATPLRLHIADSRITHIAADMPAVQAIGQELLDYLRAAENGDRAGEFAIGTNVGLTALTGNLLQDEKIPGIHIAFGNPYPHETGADWQSTVHVDIVSTGTTIDVAGRRLMTAGRFEPALLD
jgi:leucyl aminopeptidase (aminopeptidase T)